MSKTLTDILYVFSSSTLAKFIGAFAAFILPIILEPANYGVWITLLLIITYAPIAALGTVETLLKQYPYFIGKQEYAEAKRLENSVFSSILLSAILLVAAGLLSYLAILNFSLSAYGLHILIMFLTSSICIISSFFYYRIMARQYFKGASYIDFARAISSLVFLVSFSLIWQLKGAVFGFFFSETLICIFSVILSYRICGSIDFNWNYQLIGSAVRIGFPITIAFWILSLQISADRIVSMAMLGNTQTGFYGLGATFVSTIILIPAAVNRVLYPKISYGIGRNADQETILNLVLLPVRALSIVIPVLIGILIFVLPSVYHMIFPKYLPGLVSAQILLVGSFCICFIGNGANYLIASDKQKTLVCFAVMILAANYLLAISAVNLGWGIEGIALSTGVSLFLLTVLIWISAFRKMGFAISEVLGTLLNLYTPLILMCSLLLLFYLVIPFSFNDPGISSFLYAGCFVLLYTLAIFVIPPFRYLILNLYKSFKKSFRKSELYA